MVKVWKNKCSLWNDVIVKFEICGWAVHDTNRMNVWESDQVVDQGLDVGQQFSVRHLHGSISSTKNQVNFFLGSLLYVRMHCKESDGPLQCDRSWFTSCTKQLSTEHQKLIVIEWGVRTILFHLCKESFDKIVWLFCLLKLLVSINNLLQVFVRCVHPLSHLINAKHSLRKDFDQEGEEEKNAWCGGKLNALVDSYQEAPDSWIVVRVSLTCHQGPDDIDNSHIDVETNLNWRSTTGALAFQDIDKVIDLILNKSFHLWATKSKLFQGGVSKFSLDPPRFTTGTCQSVTTLAEEPEHEGVRPVTHLWIGEGFLDGVVAVQDNCKFCSNSNTEDITVMFGNLREWVAQVEDVQKWKVSKKWNSNWTWRQ